MGVHSDLPNAAVFAKQIVHFLGCDLEWKIPDIKNAIDIGRKTNLKEAQSAKMVSEITPDLRVAITDAN